MPQEEAQTLAEAVSQPPPEAAPEEGMSFEEAMRAALESEAPEVEVPEELQEPPKPPEEPEVPEVPSEAVKPAEELTEPPEETPAPSKSLARIMERETQLIDRQARLDAAQPELEELRTRVQAFESAQSSFEQNPTNFIKSLAPGADLKRIAEALWYEAQGDAAPQAYLDKKAASQHNTELAERIAKIEKGEQERTSQAQTYEAQRTMAQYQGSLEAFAKTATAESLPLVAAMQAKDPQWVAGTMLNIAQHHARATQGQVLTPDQAAASLEKHIASFQVGQPAKQEHTPPEPQGNSLRNNSTLTQPDREPEDELSDDYLRRKAFEAMGRPDLA